MCFLGISTSPEDVSRRNDNTISLPMVVVSGIRILKGIFAQDAGCQLRQCYTGVGNAIARMIFVVLIIAGVWRYRQRHWIMLVVIWFASRCQDTLRNTCNSQCNEVVKGSFRGYAAKWWIIGPMRQGGGEWRTGFHIPGMGFGGFQFDRDGKYDRFHLPQRHGAKQANKQRVAMKPILVIGHCTTMTIWLTSLSSSAVAMSLEP